MPTFGRQKKPGLSRFIPLMLIALVAYHAAVAAGHDFASHESPETLHFTLVSGATLFAGWNVALLAGGLVLLFLELLKSTRTTAKATTEHILSVLVFIIFLVEFIVVPAAGTAVFALLGLMSLIDLMAGYAISIAVAQRDLNITE
ncbi:MAG: hypothetical protein ACKV19_00660 [Verrucomicrobiales bacterium]